jgi:hypothetical protein
MNLGVKLDVTDPVLHEQFSRAMDFWAGLLDMEWHRDQTAECAMQVTYGAPETFATDDIAQADDPDSNTFRGEIAFNPTSDLTPLEAYLVSIHEIGHLLGLDHNPSPTSVMHAVYLEGPEKLEAADIAALSARHRMRHPTNTEIRLPFEVVEPTELRSATAKSKVSSTR